MAISINWSTFVISIPQADLLFIGGTLYALDTEQFWLDLKDIEDDVVGMTFTDTHIRNPSLTIAGAVYAPSLVIISPYTITFEDGQYAVRLDGTNNNLFDEGIINRNQVSIIPTNSAGLQVVDTISGSVPTSSEMADAIWDEAKAGHSTASTFGKSVTDIETNVYLTLQSLAGNVTVAGDDLTITIFDTDGTTPLRTLTMSSDGRVRTVD